MTEIERVPRIGIGGNDEVKHAEKFLNEDSMRRFKFYANKIYKGEKMDEVFILHMMADLYYDAITDYKMQVEASRQ